MRVEIALEELSSGQLPAVCAVSGEPADSTIEVRGADGRIHLVPVLRGAVRRWHLIRLAIVSLALGSFLFWLYPAVNDGRYASPATTRGLIGLTGPAFGAVAYYAAQTWFFVRARVVGTVLVIRGAHPGFAMAVDRWRPSGAVGA